MIYEYLELSDKSNFVLINKKIHSLYIEKLQKELIKSWLFKVYNRIFIFETESSYVRTHIVLRKGDDVEYMEEIDRKKKTIYVRL